MIGMRLKTRNFHSRVLLFFVALILISQVGTTIAMLMVAKRSAYAMADAQLGVAARVWKGLLAQRELRLRDSMRVLAADYAFRDAVASKDAPTTASALSNHGARVHADVAMLIDPDGQVVADTDPKQHVPRAFEYPELLAGSGAGSGTPPIVSANGQLLQLVVVPVKAPDEIGSICMGFVVGGALVDEMKAVTGVDVSLISQAQNAAIFASTLRSSAWTKLRHGFGRRDDSGNPPVVKLAGIQYITQVVPSDAGLFLAVMQLPTATIAGPLNALRQQLFWFDGVVTAICLAAALLSARWLARPLNSLFAAVHSLSASKRRKKADATKEDDELAQLSTVFHALARRAHYDALTGLPNRRLAMQRIGEAIARADRSKAGVALVFIDLNGFKQINDSLGHEMGDLVLRKTAKRLTRSMRESDTVARLGGDEFLLILENMTRAGAIKCVENLSAVVALPMQSTEGAVRVGLSAGISLYPEHTRDQATLLRLADTAMYESKTQRKGPVVFNPHAAKPGSGTPQGADRSAATDQSIDGAADDAGGTCNDLIVTWGTDRWAQKDLQTQRAKAVKLGPS